MLLPQFLPLLRESGHIRCVNESAKRTFGQTLLFAEADVCTVSTRSQRKCALSGPYCAIPRGYLSDTPPLRAMGFLVSQHPLFWAFPLGEHAKWRCDTHSTPQKGISAILARYPIKTREMGVYPPLR